MDLEVRELKDYEVRIRFRNQGGTKYEWEIVECGKKVVAFGYTKTLKEAFDNAYNRYYFVMYTLSIGERL